MTTHKSSAVQSGIMPDYAKAGVVLCRSTSLTLAANVRSGDTVQMIPVPKEAKVLKVQAGYAALPAGTTGCDIGYGGDPDAFAATVPYTAANIKEFPPDALKNVAGFMHTFTADDTVDIAFTKAVTKVPTNSVISMAVWYKMVGVLSDEK